MGILSLVNLKGLPQEAVQKKPQGTTVSRDPYAPNWELVLRGGPGAQPVKLSDEMKQYISEITYEDNADQFDKITIQFENQINQTGAGKINSIIDSKLFAEGTIVEVMFGYGNILKPVGACVLVKKEPDFPADGSPTLVISGYDALFRASRRNPKGGVSYAGFRDSQIASIIGSRNGFDISLDDPNSFAGIRRTQGIHDRVQKKGVNDYKFLKKVAEINGYDLFSKWVPERQKFGLFFQPSGKKNNKEIFTFVYSEGGVGYTHTLLNFTPKLDAYDQSTDFEVFVVEDKETKKTKFNFVDRVTAEETKKVQEENQRRFTGGNFGRSGGKQLPEDDGIKVAFKAFGRSFRFPPHKRFKSEFEARKAIEEFVKRQKENFITGSGSLIGNENVQSRQIHRLEGISEQFSGKYYFTKVVHVMSKEEGYRSDFSARKVIEDLVVQSPPGLNLTENDRLLKRLKKE